MSDDCGCARCDAKQRQAKYDAEGGMPPFRRMILCPECGNKRCPRAASHENTCTGSNAAGQVGSDYPAHDPSAPRLSIEELRAQILARSASSSAGVSDQ